MESLPKELINIVDEYNTEPGTVSLEYATKHNMSLFPKEVQKEIGSYIAPVDYADLALQKKLGAKNELTPAEQKLIMTPWSNEKMNLLGNTPYYPVLKEAYSQERLNFPPNYWDQLAFGALVNHDFTYLLFLEDQYRITRRVLSDVLDKELSDIIQDRLLLFNLLKLPEPTKDELKTIEEINQMIEYKIDTIRFIVENFPEYQTWILDRKFSNLLKNLVSTGNFDLFSLVSQVFKHKEEHLFATIVDYLEKGMIDNSTSPDFTYLTLLVQYSGLVDDFRELAADVANETVRLPKEVLLEVVNRYSNYPKVHLKILQEEGIIPS